MQDLATITYREYLGSLRGYLNSTDKDAAKAVVLEQRQHCVNAGVAAGYLRRAEEDAGLFLDYGLCQKAMPQAGSFDRHAG